MTHDPSMSPLAPRHVVRADRSPLGRSALLPLLAGFALVASALGAVALAAGGSDAGDLAATPSETARLVWWQDSQSLPEPSTSVWTTLHRLEGGLIGLLPANDAALRDPRARDLGDWSETDLYLLAAHRDLRALAAGKLPAAWSAALEAAGDPLPAAEACRSIPVLVRDEALALIRLPAEWRAIAEAPGGRCQLLRPPRPIEDIESAPALPSAPRLEGERAELWGALRQALRADRMFTDLDYLSTELETRYAYTPQMELACDYVRAQFDSLGLTTWFDEFSYTGHDLKNVVAVKEGALDPSVIYLIGGHLDSISSNPWTLAPGAEDNGSGAAAVVETARLLAPLTCDYTIYFVCFSAEEQGMRGSEHFAAWAEQQGLDIRGVLIHDMIGYYDPANQDLWLEGFREGPSSSWLLNLVQANASRYAGLSVYQYPGDGWGSDHVPFHNHGYPAILALEYEWDSYDCYHQPCDTVDWLDAGLWSRIASAMTISLGQLAGVQDSLGSLTGRVSAQGGGPLAGATVSIVGTGYADQMTTTGGGFGWPQLLPGDYTLLAERYGYEPATLPVTVPSGGTLQIEIVLAAEASSSAAEAGADRRRGPRLRATPSVSAGGGAVVRLSLPQEARGELALYAPDGRLIRRLLPAAHLAAGEHAFAWDGRDHEGRELPAGVYAARWQGESGMAEAPLVRLR